MKSAFVFATVAGLLTLSFPGTALAADVPIDQSNGQFAQAHESLAAGDSLILNNKDSGPHDISVIDPQGDPTDLGVQMPGASVKVKFADPGNYVLRCSIAPSMKMSVSVN